jgi:hypothetical protein
MVWFRWCGSDGLVYCFYRQIYRQLSTLQNAGSKGSLRSKTVICGMNAPEFWQRGPVAGIPPMLQPVAHTLLQARAEVNALMEGFPKERLWERPAGLASPGFHLQHLSGVLDRLLTYAEGKMLSRVQLAELVAEGQPHPGAETVQQGLDRFNRQVDNALQQIAQTTGVLTEVRLVGRDRIPSTVIGLLFHAAEHTMRHTGQLLVTVRILRAENGSGEGSINRSGNRME